MIRYSTIDFQSGDHIMPSMGYSHHLITTIISVLLGSLESSISSHRTQFTYSNHQINNSIIAVNQTLNPSWYLIRLIA